VALFFVGVAVSGLTLLGVQPWISEVFNGAAVVVAISLAAVFRHRRTGVRTLGQ
jgi:ribose transport system permease protein